MKKKWWKAWLVQFALMTAACAAAELSYYISALLRDILIWAAIPLLGAYTAMKAVLGGLNNYAAWIAPPVCAVLASIALWGFVPHAGPVLVCAFVSLVGAAAGDVRSRQRRG